MSSKTNILISIVDYHKADRVLIAINQLKSILKDYDFKITIYDNSCNDKNSKKLKKITDNTQIFLTISNKNFGYTKATNMSISDHDSDYVLILNPDIIFSDEFSFSPLIDLLKQDKSLGVIGVKQINNDKSMPRVIRRFPNLGAQLARRSKIISKFPFFNKQKSQYEAIDTCLLSTNQVDWLQSSFWFLKRDVWNKLGGLDERFFLFMSDPDFCLRLKNLGYKSLYFSEQFVYADGKRASAGSLFSIFKNKPLQYHTIDAIRYYLKHGFIQ